MQSYFVWWCSTWQCSVVSRHGPKTGRNFAGQAAKGYRRKWKLPNDWVPGKTSRGQHKLPSPGNSRPVVVGEPRFPHVCRGPLTALAKLYDSSAADGKTAWVSTGDYVKTRTTQRWNPLLGVKVRPPIARGWSREWIGGVVCYDHGGKEARGAAIGECRQFWGTIPRP